jgi:YVTN family beta-propeller protein
MAMSMFKSCLLGLALVVVNSATSAQSTPAPMLLAVAKLEHALVLIDPSTLKVLARVAVGNDAHEVVATSDGKTAYVSNYGTGVYNTLARVDLVNRKALPSVSLGPLQGPHGLAMEGGKVWFTAERAKALGRLDPATGQVDWVLGTGQNRTHMLYVRADQQLIVAANVESGTMSIFRRVRKADDSTANLPAEAQRRLKQMGIPNPPEEDWEGTTVAVGQRPEGFDVSPDGRELWVSNARDSTVSIIDLTTNRVSATFSVNAAIASRLRFTPDGRRVLISSLGTPNLLVMDAATRQQISLIPVGHGSGGIVVQPDGRRAYVACSPDDSVAVVDLQTLAVVGRIDAVGEPDGMAWAGR